MLSKWNKLFLKCCLTPSSVTVTGRVWNLIQTGGAFGVGLLPVGLQDVEQPAEGKPSSRHFFWRQFRLHSFGYHGNKIPASWDYYSLGLCLMCEVLEKQWPAFPSLLWLRDRGMEMEKECNLVAKNFVYLLLLANKFITHINIRRG